MFLKMAAALCFLQKNGFSDEKNLRVTALRQRLRVGGWG
jgi:hypothetical protein